MDLYIRIFIGIGVISIVVDIIRFVIWGKKPFDKWGEKSHKKLKQKAAEADDWARENQEPKKYCGMFCYWYQPFAADAKEKCKIQKYRKEFKGCERWRDATMAKPWWYNGSADDFHSGKDLNKYR
jgi:hypothetical protein